MYNKLHKNLIGVLCFIIPFLLYFITKSDSLALADAAEFALVAKIGSIAHAPGFPSYIIFGWIWLKLLSLISSNVILNLILFSIVSTSVASVLFYNTLRLIFINLSFKKVNDLQTEIVSAITSISF